MAKLIRNQQQLREHVERVRQKGESDRALAVRLGIHWNTITRLKHGVDFDTPKAMKSLGLTVLYEVAK